MRLSFDPGKNRRNIAERGLSFELVADLDWESAVAVEDTRKDYGETPLRVMARLGGRLHMAVITYRGDAIHPRWKELCLFLQRQTDVLPLSPGVVAWGVVYLQAAP